MGTSADMLVTPFIPLCIGFSAGVISTLGFNFVPNFIYKYLKLHDTCGVIYLHLIPGILGGLIGGLVAGVTDESYYGPDQNSVYSMMGDGYTRGHSKQGGIQIAALFTSLAIGALSGAAPGGILRIPYIWGPPKIFYHDKAFFEFAHGDHDANIDNIDDESEEEKEQKEEPKKVEKRTDKKTKKQQV